MNSPGEQTARARWGIASRVLAASLGGYAVVALAMGLGARALVALADWSPAEAVVLTSLLAFACHTGVAIWVFSAGSAWLAWRGIAAVAALGSVLWVALG